MAGAGRKVFQFNEILTAVDVNQYLMDQSVMRFADSAARSSAIGTPTEGMVSWLDDEDQVEVYDGSQWVNFTGDINQVTAGTALTGGGAEGNVTLNVDINAVGSAVNITAAQVTDVTASAAELNILDGVTATTADLNLLDGVTATTTELNFIDGVTSNVQTQLDDKQDDLITTEGDVIVGNSGGTAVRLPIGPADTYLSSDGTAVSWSGVSGGGGTGGLETNFLLMGA